MGYANLDDIAKLQGGTMRFTFNNVAYQGTIKSINYFPLGPGGINVSLAQLRTVDGGMSVTEGEELLDFTISCFLADVTNRPRELIVQQLVPQKGFGDFFSFHVRD